MAAPETCRSHRPGFLDAPDGRLLGALDPRGSRRRCRGVHVRGRPAHEGGAVHLAMYASGPAGRWCTGIPRNSVAVSVSRTPIRQVLPPLTAYYAMRIGTLRSCRTSRRRRRARRVGRRIRGRVTTRCCSEPRPWSPAARSPRLPRDRELRRPEALAAGATRRGGRSTRRRSPTSPVASRARRPVYVVTVVFEPKPEHAFAFVARCSPTRRCRARANRVCRAVRRLRRGGHRQGVFSTSSTTTARRSGAPRVGALQGVSMRRSRLVAGKDVKIYERVAP